MRKKAKPTLGQPKEVRLDALVAPKPAQIVRRALQPETRRVLDAIMRELAGLERLTIGTRGLYYLLISAGDLKPDDERGLGYALVMKAAMAGRLRGEIEPDSISDGSRRAWVPETYNGLADYAAQRMKDPYHRNIWEHQAVYPEVWIEKTGLAGAVEPITDKYGVTLRPFGGDSSFAFNYDIACTFSRVPEGKPIRIFYGGDHDPSGERIPVTILRNVQQILYDRCGWRDFGHIQMLRFGLFAEDIAQYNLVPLKTKPRGPCWAEFERRYGRGAKGAELDALPLRELHRRIRNCIEGCLDMGEYQRLLMIEAAESEGRERVYRAMTEAVQ